MRTGMMVGLTGAPTDLISGLWIIVIYLAQMLHVWNIYLHVAQKIVQM